MYVCVCVVLSDLEVFHEHSDDNVDEHELSDEDENDEEDWRDDTTDTAVVNAVVRRVAVLSQRVLSINHTVSSQSPHAPAGSVIRKFFRVNPLTPTVVLWVHL